MLSTDVSNKLFIDLTLCYWQTRWRAGSNVYRHHWRSWAGQPPGSLWRYGAGPGSCAADGGLPGRSLASSSLSTLPGISTPLPGVGCPDLDILFAQVITHMQRETYIKRAHYARLHTNSLQNTLCSMTKHPQNYVLHILCMPQGKRGMRRESRDAIWSAKQLKAKPTLELF